MSNRVTMGQDDSMRYIANAGIEQTDGLDYGWKVEDGGKAEYRRACPSAWSQSYANQRGFEESGKNGTG